MRTLALTLVLALFCLPANAQQIYDFKILEGEVPTKVLAGHNTGSMLTVQDLSTRDTLRLWVEGVTPDRPPEWSEAKEADRVAWCYAGRYPDSRHLVPGAKMVFFFHYRQDEKEYLAIGPQEDFRHIEPHIDTRGVALYAPFLDR